MASPVGRRALDPRVLLLTSLAIAVAAAAGLIAQGLTRLIGLITNLCFYGRLSTSFTSPAGNHLGAWVIAIPIGGALIVGVMARYGSRAIRGHGIPEAMEMVLLHRSKIPARITLLKPISAAISIGTGGPFGAEGPIIATGGALGSLVGQLVRVTTDERKTLLAAGAAAGMTATFGSPVSAVLLAVELLLFEYRARSLIPVVMACCVAAAVRIAFVGALPVFAMPTPSVPGAAAMACYVALGATVGLASVGVTKVVYWIEDGFERLPIHWMWWPALGAVVVGVVGLVSPHTLGVGYDNIEHIVSGEIAGEALLALFLWKWLSWTVSLGSGTSGGTLAPLFTIGGGLGATLGGVLVALAPGLGVDVKLAALVGMAAMFAGASRALLTSVVFAFETTRQPVGLLPLLGGCAAAYFVSSLLMENTIMTEKLARRGTRVPTDYSADFLDRLLVRDAGSRALVTLSAAATIAQARAAIAGIPHQGFPVIDSSGQLTGVVTRRDLDQEPDAGRILSDIVTRAALTIFEDATLREAADLMTSEDVGRLAVTTRGAPNVPVAVITRSDLIAAHARRLDETHTIEENLLGRSSTARTHLQQ